MKRIAALVCLLHVCYIASAQQQKGEIDSSLIPNPQQHYLPEYTFDQPSNHGAWLNVAHTMHVSFAETSQPYFRTEVPSIRETTTWQDTGWKGERLNTMILVWSPDTVNQVRFTLHDLVNAKGSLIPKESMQVNMVRYVVSNYPYNDTNTTCGLSPYKNAYLFPDRFEEFERFDVPGQTVRPVWLSLNIPSTAQAGEYTGILEVTSETYHTVLQLNIKVQNKTLPNPHEWQHRLDLWQNPWVVAWYNHVKPWGEEHKAFLKKHLKLYAEAGGKYITTYAVHSPWSDDSYNIEETMIEWIKQPSGTWKFDYSIFDEYVQLAMQAGIDKAITIYTPIPWGNRFRYIDAKTGNYVYETWPATSDAFKTAWDAFLTSLRSHLQQKGWLDKTYLGINETTLDETLATIKVIRQHSPAWKITYAGNWHKELDTLLNDYSFLYGHEPSPEELKARAARGATSTYYVCCNPAKPNNFLFSPPDEGRWISWYTAVRGYNGFLRWAYDAWPADPMRDARHTIWPAGDCFLVYPGGNSCIRFEKLREGISDFEKIRIIKQLAAKSSSTRVKQLLQQLNAHLASLLDEHDFNIEKVVSDIDKGRQLINQLSDAL
ncbi:MAG TPA: glycoside hydrolase domain-containing protein [Chitinophagaceae bacterium]|nr:glycoside hydrolase domain-containing protein [Chitinophagaceae bacterium]